MNRRQILLSCAALAIGAEWHAGSPAQEPRDDNLDYTDYSKEPPIDYQLYGTSPPVAAEVAKAMALMDAAPTGNTPSDVLRYYEGITARNDRREFYNAAWAEEWNPVIVEFYYSTSLPRRQIYAQGDTVAWCAACLNYVLNRLGKQGTGSAMSGSFRLGKGLGTATDTPKAGEDIIVFKNATGIDVGHGHVGIYMGETRDHYVVLGGNQKAGRRYSSINTTMIAKSGGSLKLASFRSFASIPAKAT